MVGLAPFAVCLSLAGIVPAAASEHWTAPAEGGPDIDGVWRTRRYGQVLVSEHGVATLYDVAGTWCYRDPDPQAGEDDAYRLVAADGPDRIAFADAPDRTRHVFDRIAALPSACRIERRWTAAQIDRLVAATFADFYPGFGRRRRTQAALTDALATLPAGADDQNGARDGDGADRARQTDAIGTLNFVAIGWPSPSSSALVGNALRAGGHHTGVPDERRESNRSRRPPMSGTAQRACILC